MDLKQITDKLNKEFKGNSRKLVFWYDENAEFNEDIESLQLENAKLFRLENDANFYAKYFFEVEDRATNYLIYAPFKKPTLRDNHLADTLLYSKEFFADRISLIMADLKIKEAMKPVMQKYVKFFNEDKRLKVFQKLQIENYDQEIIEIGIMSALCKIQTVNFDEVLRSVVTEGITKNNKLVAEFGELEILPQFWSLCEKYYGYRDDRPTLEKLFITMLITYTDHYFVGELPKTWQAYISAKKNNVAVFIGNLMNNMLFRDKYKEIARHVAIKIKASEYIGKLQIDSYINCDTFENFDEAIINWIIERLLEENTFAQVNKQSIIEICDYRIKKHYGEKYLNKFQMLKNAFNIIGSVKEYKNGKTVDEVIDRYINSGCLIDYNYRKFYYYYDKIDNTADYEELRELVENIYTNDYLANITVGWTSLLDDNLMGDWHYPRQNKFYDSYLKAYEGKERIIVIVSDALRYECANELFNKFKDDAKCEPDIEWSLGVLPSITMFGMAAVLPHKVVKIDENKKITVDGMLCDNMEYRQKVLQNYAKDSVCISIDDVNRMKQKELRDTFAYKNIVYIYHDKIDKIGENKESEVFNACDEAIDEIHKLVIRLTRVVSAAKYIITSDHGFIYKHDRLNESDKVNINRSDELLCKRRFLISDNKPELDGTVTFSMDYLLGKDSNKFVTVPKGMDIFKVTGGGQNYVHGGASLQEMLIPVLKVKTIKGKMETANVEITMISIPQKITNLITYIDFLQVENVSDTVKAATYKLFFMSEDEEKISNENIINADKKDCPADNRTFRERFTFKNKKYDRSKKYYLVIIDENTEIELVRYEFFIDIAFADDFGF